MISSTRSMEIPLDMAVFSSLFFYSYRALLGGKHIGTHDFSIMSFNLQGINAGNASFFDKTAA